MPAPIGNTNAEKWTEATVMPILKGIQDKITGGEDWFWIGDALLANDLYKDIWQYWKDKFKENEVVFRTLKKIDLHFEGKLFRMALKEEVNVTAAIFGLKNNYEWKDKSEVDHLSAGQAIGGFNYVKPNGSNHNSNGKAGRSLAKTNGQNH